MLNKRKGPAVWVRIAILFIFILFISLFSYKWIYVFKGHRAQIDRVLYKRNMQTLMLNTKNLTILPQSANDILIENEDGEKQKKIVGVILENGVKVNCKSLIITTGTFLRAHINIGLEVRPAGRLGDKASVELGNSLEKIGFKMGRLKTGSIIKNVIWRSILKKIHSK